MLEEDDRKEIIKMQEATHTSIVAFVLSLFIPLVGLILGLRAKSEIDQSEHTKSGSAFAVAAIWIGAIGTLAWAALLALVLVLSIGGHRDHFGWMGEDMHRGFARYQNYDQGMMAPNQDSTSGSSGYGMMQPTPDQTPGTSSN